MASIVQDGFIKTEQLSDDIYATQSPQQVQEVTLDSVRSLVTSRDLAKLDRGVVTARSILSQLRLSMAQAKEQENQNHWLDKFDRLMGVPTEASRTIVAIVGQTGAGKSSLINALLDEVELLPTNGMRACTVVASEIIYNTIDDPQQAYRAEIQFRSKQDWDQELANLFEDVIEDSAADNQEKPNWEDPTSEAGIAYAKIRAVYPKLTHVDLLKSKPERLAREASISRVLGSTKKMAFSTAAELAGELAKYLDSANKNTDASSKASNEGSALWPLIEVARIYCKSSILSGGVVIVDLPGTADMNAARNAVAVDYLAKSSAVFVAAPIKRAVDDQSAKQLMGKAFKLQLLMDGNYSNVTFICTSCDEINIKESIKSLDRDGGIQAAIARREQLRQMIEDRQTKLGELEQRVQFLKADFASVEKERKAWTKREHKIARGGRAFVRVPSKRKHSDESGSDSDREEVTVQKIKEEIEQLDVQVNTISTECTRAEQEYSVAKTELTALEFEKNQPALDGVRLCIQGRNSVCQKAIQTDFANGIKEIDEEGKDEVDAASSLSSKRRDYSLVAQSLPVFTISSKAYQQLQGRLDQCEVPVQGFSSVEDTGIPALQRHAKTLTYEDQLQKHKYFLNSFLKLLTSLVVVTASCYPVAGVAIGASAIELTQQEKDDELEYLRIQLDHLAKQCSTDIYCLREQVQKMARQRLTWKNTQAVRAGGKAAPFTIRRWRCKGVRGYGLACNTYKAICRRRGEKTASPKSRNFNDDLLEPYKSQMGPTWEEVFVTNIPAAFGALPQRIRGGIESFHNGIASREALKMRRLASLLHLGKNLEEYQEVMRRVTEVALSEISAAQRQASRCLYSKIQDLMSESYAKCSRVSGRGSLEAMEYVLLSFIGGSKGTTRFSLISKSVIEDVTQVFLKVEQDLLESLRVEICDVMYEDYKQLITLGERMEASKIALGRCHAVLGKVDDQFKAILLHEDV